MKLDSTNPAVQGCFDSRRSVRIIDRNITRWCQFCLSLITLLIPFAMHAQVCQFTAGEITGPSNACAYTGSSGQIATYSVVTTDASAFTWQLPTNATLQSGQGTNTILVKYKNDFTGGAISVQIGNACGGDGASRTIQVGKMRPPAPLSMDGPTVVCDLIDSGVPAVYTISAVPGATGYRWIVPDYATLVNGQGTTSITILFSSQFRSGNVQVGSVSPCGTSANLKYYVSATGPGRPGPIAGKTHGICGDNNIIEYSIEPVRDATSYLWSTNVPGAAVDNQGIKAIITFPFFSSGSVSVLALGACPTNAWSSIAVSSKGATPDSVRGPELVCAGSVQIFSVDLVDGATDYDWTVPEGSIINSGNGSPSINVTIGQVGGMVTVRASSECDAGTPVSKDLQVEECEPPTCEVSVFPNPTSGLFNVNFCATLDGVYNIYVTDVITGQILYHINGNYQAGENVIGADISNLGDGYYVLYLVTEEIVHHENLVLDHNSP
jgi:hypothetical protein